MRLRKCAFLVDVDNTLLNTEKLKYLIEKDLIRRFKGLIDPLSFWEEYDKIQKKYGYNNLAEFAVLLSDKYQVKNPSEISDLFYSADFKKCLNPNALNLISSLNKIGRTIIYSLGHKDYQSIKIKKSGIEKAAGKNKVLIVQDKIQGIKNILTKLKDDGYKQITVIDDRVDVLESAKKFYPKTICIWFQFGKYKNIYPTNKLHIDYKSYSLLEVEDVSKRLICKLQVPSDKTYLQIWKGVVHKHINQLISYTKTDDRIRNFTHDSERFKNKGSFEKWRTKDKIIYTLTDNDQNLLGIIWFAKKQYLKYKYTFAIRTYSTVRGKHIAEKFMRRVFEDFEPRNIWLRTAKENSIAIKLYESFGFNIIEEDNQNIFMVYP